MSKITNVLKKYLPILSLLFLIAYGFDYAAIRTIQFIFNPVEMYALAEINVSKKTMEKQMPARLYALTEVYKAGLDVNKVDDMIGDCENKEWNPEADFINWKNKAGIDRGLWMLNSISHKEVSNSCAYDLECSTKEAIRIIKQRGLKEWACGN